ncbi:helix-turn-helix domain-containing protein [Rhodoplanes sp. Z2-YC6860]|uniref:helix-turn-helix domain-containing protein n=1 Tax=Rhodoplanes sp. Z2-YC6860 TaxID=674703 RepID=UPI0012ED99C6|nr:helix-turn-helix domain-containing protein [Rhodoplanes sp. Z2-YC6860]
MSHAASDAAGMHSFILAAEPRGGKLQQWQSAILETFGAIDMRIRDDAHFSGAIRRVGLQGLQLTEVRSSSECARRTRRHLSGSVNDAVALLLIRHGNVQIDQYTRRNVVGADSFTLLDLAEPYEWMHVRPAHVIGIKMSRQALAERVGFLGSHAGVMRSAATGIGRLTADFLESFASQADGLPASAGAVFERQFLDLAELLLTARKTGTSLPQTTPAEAVYWRALAFIDRRLSDVDLSPQDIASAIPVSLRHLHATFQSFGASVYETILSRRLALCHTRLLADPQARIGDIADQAGFRNHAHFSTRFKAMFGVSPRDIQRSARTSQLRE